jgi:small subunit ribosomal protein S17
MSETETNQTEADDNAEQSRGSRKVREGLVGSTKMDKTIVVKVVDRVRHPRYRKTLQRTTNFYAHDEANEAREGDRVRIAETRPMSKQKRWRLVEILERAR